MHLFLDFPQHDTHSEGGLSQEASQSTFLCDFLYQAPTAASKLASEKKLLEGIFSAFRFFCQIKLYSISKTIGFKFFFLFSLKMLDLILQWRDIFGGL